MFSPDKKLIERVLARDETALSELIRSFMPPLYRFVQLMVHDRDLTEDIVQETWIKIWNSLARYDQSRPFTTWAFTIAKNTAFDAMKKRIPLPLAAFSREAEQYIEDSVPSLETDITEILARQDAAHELDQVLATLASQYRLVLTLHYREDLSLQEIAAITGIQYNTVKSHHQRALAKLREELRSVPAASSPAAQPYKI